MGKYREYKRLCKTKKYMKRIKRMQNNITTIENYRKFKITNTMENIFARKWQNQHMLTMLKTNKKAQ